jgi:hypothetical protein
MYQPETFRISTPATIPTYIYVGPYESSVSYQYPYNVVVNRDDRSDVLLSNTKAIRRELREIRSDIGEIKRRQAPPTYYMVKQDYPNDVCSICNSSSSKNQQKQHLQNPVHYCDSCHSFVEGRAYSAGPKVRTRTPSTIYQCSYNRSPSYSSPHGHLERQITLNELETKPPWSSACVQHPRHWIPTASKNSYPNRRWNLRVRHPEP